MNSKIIINKYGSNTFINYLMIVQAILFSDLDSGHNSVTCVYDTLENGRLVAVFNTNRTCARFFKVTESFVGKAANHDHLLKGRFKVEKFECETTSNKTEYYKLLFQERDEKQLRRYFRERKY